MLKNYFIVAFRNLLRNKFFSILNISGLVIGLTVSILIVLYVIHELSYDRFHEHSCDIYRVSVEGETSGQAYNYPVTPALLAKHFTVDFSEVLSATRLKDAPDAFFTYNDKKYHENHIFYADSMFFNVFSFNLLQGNPNEVFCMPYCVVLTESLARKYFGNENPIGKKLKCNNDESYIVKGVIEDTPDNSHFKFSMLISFPTIKFKPLGKYLNLWTSLSYFTYIHLHKNVNLDVFSKKIKTYIDIKSKEKLREHGVIFNLYLQPLTSIHLHSALSAEIEANSDILYIYLLIAIAVLILLIACINFMNLSTARSAKRAKEVGIRKVLGAKRKMLIIQFISESVIQTLIALFISFVLIEFILPSFNQLTDKNININYIKDWSLTGSFFFLAFFTGVVAGSYPAFYLSAFIPIKTLKGNLKAGAASSALRGILVFIQFAISIALIICTGIIFSQIKYVKTKRLGFAKENLMVIPLRNTDLSDKGEWIKTKLSAAPGIVSIATSSSVPGAGLNGNGFYPKGKSKNEPWLIYTFSVDYDYVETSGMKLLAGRNFSPQLPEDTLGVLINETLVKELSWDNPIGKTMTGTEAVEYRKTYTVIGVLQDFHNQSLHEKITPMLLQLGLQDVQFITLRIKSDKIQQTIDALAEIWIEIDNRIPFDYYFIDDYFNAFYQSEQRVARIFMNFSFIAIFIALLGLFGLSNFISEQRTKEIGIRKVLGASVFLIAVEFSKDFAKWVLLANLLAWPMAYLSMSYWLQNFEYRTNFSIWIFILGGAIALFIAVATSFIQVTIAASANPVKSLRYE